VTSKHFWQSVFDLNEQAHEQEQKQIELHFQLLKRDRR